MKKRLDVENWERKEHYKFFTKFEEPFWGVTTEIDCGMAYEYCKANGYSFTLPDSCPKITFGKMTDEHGVKTMPVSIHVHHALVDGYHVGQFVEKYQRLMNEKPANNGLNQ
ncbi:MAG: CatA-like O-acetyltransferase [Carboxylicivirga sp.]|jgi:chloramphenicol O-acetyltransferase|nr:CatA-like O-acetyltransferase [Carboxylicivirga sp.]